MTQAPPNTIDDTLIKSVVQATTDVLQTMATTSAEFKRVVNNRDDISVSGDLSAIIGMVGDNGEGSFSLTFKNTLADLLVARLVGLTPADISPADRADGVREMVNMITGNVKSMLSRETGAVMKLTIPTVITGEGHQVYTAKMTNASFMIVEFESEGEAFWLEITFKANQPISV